MLSDQDKAILRDTLHCAHPSNIRTSGNYPDEKDFEESDIRYGKGIVVGVVAGLMTSDHCRNGHLSNFDMAWVTCLALNTGIDARCIPDNWPKLKDYVPEGYTRLERRLGVIANGLARGVHTLTQAKELYYQTVMEECVEIPSNIEAQLKEGLK